MKGTIKKCDACNKETRCKVALTADGKVLDFCDMECYRRWLKENKERKETNESS